MRMKTQGLAVFVILVILVPGVWAEQGGTPSTPNQASDDSISGDWEGTLTIGDRSGKFKFRIKIDGERAVMESIKPDGTTSTLTGKWIGKKLSFTQEGPGARSVMTATLQAGKLVGEVNVTAPNGAQFTGRWEANRVITEPQQSSTSGAQGNTSDPKSAQSMKTGSLQGSKHSATNQPSSTQPQRPPAKQLYVFRRKTDATTGSSSDTQRQGVKVIEGTINGLIVQRGKVEQSPSKEDPSKMVYTVSYYLTNGSDIASIDEDGVSKDSNMLAVFIVTQGGAPPDAADAILRGMTMPQGAMFGSTSAGGTIIRVSGATRRAGGANTDILLGEFRVNEQTAKGQLIPALEISAGGGVLKIPVENIVLFKEKVEAEAQKPTSPSGDGTGKIEGMLVNADSKKPLPNVEIELSRADEGVPKNEKEVGKIKTDEKGQYFFSGLKPGKYLMSMTVKYFREEDKPCRPVGWFVVSARTADGGFVQIAMSNEIILSANQVSKMNLDLKCN